MTETMVGLKMGEAIEVEVANAREIWAKRNRKRNHSEEETNARIEQVLAQVVIRKGGRLVIHTQVFAKGVSGTEHTYNRYQHTPKVGYVRVYHRDM